MPTSNTAIPGIGTVYPLQRKSESGGDFMRDPENKLIEKEWNASQVKSETANLELCAAKLPEGTSCNTRIEKKGFFFCSGIDSNCPLSKERA